MEWVTLNSLCLGNQIAVNFATEWSKDGRLFIVSDSCVYVLKLTPKMTNTENNLSFTRSEIKLGSYHAAQYTGINYEEILLNVSQQNMYHQILNCNMTPKTKFTTSPVATPVSAAWSPTPVDEIYKINALLGVISITGNLEIYVQDRFKWSIAVNVTECWVKHLKTIWKTEKVPNNDNRLCELHSSRVNTSLASCFAWSKIHKDNDINFVYILVGHVSGYISLWQLNYFNFHNEEIKVELIHSFKTNVDNITSVQIYSIDNDSVWIIIGNLDGYVQANKIDFKRLDRKEIIEIWTHKDVRVNKIVTIGIDQNVGIIILKGPFLIFAVLSKDDTLQSTTHFNIGNLCISGIQLICPGNYVITTTTGVIQKLKIVKTSKGYEMKLSPVSSDLKWDYLACYGITKSPNEILWGVLTLPCKMTDHLALRSPIQMIFCTAKDFDPGSYLKINPTMQLINSWECIEILRCLSAKNNTLPCNWLVKIEKYDELSLYEIRLFMWLALICQTFIQKRSKCRKLRSTLPPMNDLKDILYFKYRLERIHYLLNKIDTNENCTEFDCNSLFLLYDAVKLYQNDENYSIYFEKSIDEEVENITNKYNLISMTNVLKCLWCEETSKPCATNHPDQRCCISGVQIPDLAKWECERCGLPAHELIEEEYLFCPLCDIPLIQII